MASGQTVREAILYLLRSTPEYELEDLVMTCSEFTWNQVFHEVDRLTRSGEVHMTRHGLFGYRLALSPPISERAAGTDSLIGREGKGSGVVSHEPFRRLPGNG